MDYNEFLNIKNNQTKSILMVGWVMKIEYVG